MEMIVDKKIIQKLTICKDFYENAAWQSEKLACGLDEAGRGCFAGPVVAAAVILPKNTSNPLLRDSKLMSVHEREIAFQWIKENCFWSAGIINHRIIDNHNILNATKLAMKKALVQTLTLFQQNSKAPRIQGSLDIIDSILIDAVHLDLLDIGMPEKPVYSFNFGESHSQSIAAASIVAKETRDKIMRNLDPVMGSYHFRTHKGYGTPKHHDILDQHGQSLIHRTTYLKKYFQKKLLREVQKSLF